MGQANSVSTSSAVLLNLTLGTTNLLRSAVELSTQGGEDLSNPSKHSTSALAVACLLVYDTIGTYLPGYRLERKLLFRKGHIDLHAWFFVKHNTSEAILSIRGTRSMGNMMSNILMAHATIEDDVIAVLQEFIDACKQSKLLEPELGSSPSPSPLSMPPSPSSKRFVEDVIELKERTFVDGYNITCTGHSLGGYWASAFAAHANLECITFCSPRNITGLNFHACGDWVINGDPTGTYCQRHDVVLPLFTHGIAEVATYVIQREK